QEWRGVGGNPLEADLNQDGTITPEELIHRIVVYGRHRSLRLVRPGSEVTAEPAAVAPGRASEAGTSAPATLNPAAASDPFPGAPGQADDADEAAAERAREQARRGRKFYIPRNRLPAGIAGWFIDRDADGDGQITMREFSASWSPDVSAQFSAYDRNRDGVITAAESVSGGGKPNAAEPADPTATSDSAPRGAN
ncbi:MAG: hypothetical protein JNG90_08805, partial [Planctomycetaceae bacterium]|nr:hypothetical protein [Planctomycetaceae bacterium]